MNQSPIRFTNESPDVEVTAGKLNFNYLKNNPPALPTGPDLPAETPKKSRRKSSSVEGSTDIIKAEGDVIETRTLDTYQENLNVLKNTIGQIDSLSLDLKKDFDALRSSKVVRGKYQYESMISKNLTELLSAKVMAIKEINNTIKNSNDLDYRKEKDRRDQEMNNDDQQIMNLYNAFVSSPISQGMGSKGLLGPTTEDMTVAGSSGIVRYGNHDVEQAGYERYVNNLSPTQNLMRYERDPNVKQVVVYDKLTGEKHFDVRNIATGESIPNVPIKDDIFMADTTVDPIRKIARNISLNETYPVIVINENASLNEY